jgi:hypothetical protein
MELNPFLKYNTLMLGAGFGCLQCSEGMLL